MAAKTRSTFHSAGASREARISMALGRPRDVRLGGVGGGMSAILVRVEGRGGEIGGKQGGGGIKSREREETGRRGVESNLANGCQPNLERFTLD